MAKSVPLALKLTPFLPGKIQSTPSSTHVELIDVEFSPVAVKYVRRLVSAPDAADEVREDRIQKRLHCPSRRSLRDCFTVSRAYALKDLVEFTARRGLIAPTASSRAFRH